MSEAVKQYGRGIAPYAILHSSAVGGRAGRRCHGDAPCRRGATRGAVPAGAAGGGGCAALRRLAPDPGVPWVTWGAPTAAPLPRLVPTLAAVPRERLVSFFLKEKQHQSIAWRFIRVFFALVRTLATEKAHKWPITAYIALLGVKNFLPLRSLEKIHQPALLADVPLGVHRHFHPPNLDQLQSNPPPIGYCEP